MKQVLVVEDDRNLNQGLCLALKDQDIQVMPCFDLKSAREQLTGGAAELVLLDINLPDGSGLELLHEIKTGRKPVPVILLTANDTEMDVVMGLEHGADDYITKPFSLAILRARVKTQLRRELARVSKSFVIDSYRFDFEYMEFYKADTPVELSKTEQKLLRLLVENQGVTLNRATLLDRVWTDGAEYVDENALSVTVKRLRDKLGAAKYIKTVYGLGYVWVVKQDE
ncbi:response regulator transcription factor [Desulforamulus aeronauticus]|uniref:Stage 0 sporulation protein A homolog n=1 Tax=Desulforamulus aeronauticus DSM 10349 TaxID=1121421 RepID=A0A1M6VZ28_9FIRM|nr:response regulator transcription factor [Desulforamulus aeronauticus]SHK86699.1 DNA-binding response regulator, OmpR family, contains REC and winged-helix (wHTH) domain [Desulforamulus aeronauticus DSM 10349]